jgi:hypothetical protein
MTKERPFVVLASDHAARLEKIRRMEKQTGRQA